MLSEKRLAKILIRGMSFNTNVELLTSFSVTSFAVVLKVHCDIPT